MKLLLNKNLIYFIKKTNFIELFGYYNLFKIVYYFFLNYKYYVKKIPLVQYKITQERNKIITNIKNEFDEQIKHLPKFNELPINGITKPQLIKLFNLMVSKKEVDYTIGKVSGATYSNNKELDLMLNDIFPYFNKSNPLHTNIYPSVRKMEQECVKIMLNLFNGSNECCGVFTSGGTESILMACKTYRDYFKKTNPEIIVSDTVHCAFNKACKYFNIKLVSIKSCENGLFNLKNLVKKINKNTILIVASTPSYNLGIIDQVRAINTICLNHNIPLHLDACIGSFLVNYFDNLIGFNLKGVTSISADFHKYGNSPKGASCIMYNSKNIMKYQYFIDDKWSGGVYATSSFTGSRCGNIVAMTWATLMYYGYNGYKKNYHEIIELKNYFVKEIKKIDNIEVIGNPQLSIIALKSKTININIIAEDLKKNKWEVNVIQNPNGFHFCLTQYHTKVIIDSFIIDLKQSIKDNINNKSEYSPCIYGTMQKINDSEIIEEVISDYLNCINGIY